MESMWLVVGVEGKESPTDNGRSHALSIALTIKLVIYEQSLQNSICDELADLALPASLSRMNLSVLRPSFWAPLWDLDSKLVFTVLSGSM